MVQQARRTEIVEFKQKGVCEVHVNYNREFYCSLLRQSYQFPQRQNHLYLTILHKILQYNSVNSMIIEYNSVYESIDTYLIILLSNELVASIMK